MTESSDEDSQSASHDETGSTASSVPLSGLKVVLKLKRAATGGGSEQTPSKQRRQQKQPAKEERVSPDLSTEGGDEVLDSTSPGRGRPRGRGGRGRGSRGGRGRGRGAARLTAPRRRRKPAEQASSDNEKSEDESGSEEEEDEGERDNASEPAEASKPPEFVAPLPITPGEQGKKKTGLAQDSSLTKVLTYLHRYLQRKDTQGFFGDPVDDDVAPGYSQIISQPMDFSTMHAKIEARRYANIADFKHDFKLMCSNAMRYNAEETIYYKAAKRLLQLGLKLLSKERLTSLRATLASMAQLTAAEMGFDYTKVKVTEAVSLETAQQLAQGDGLLPPTSSTVPIQQQELRQQQPPPPRHEERPLTASEIASKCRASHQRMLDKAEAEGRRPAQLGYVRKPDDGTTGFVFVSPGGGSGMISETERVINLGECTAPMSTGQGTLLGVNSFKELPQNELRPISFHDYGSFCSFAPSFDSTFATLSPEDSALLLSTYGTDTAVTYATSLKRFVRKAGATANWIVDGRLNKMTNSTHTSKGAQSLIESKLTEIERLNKAAANAGDTNSLLDSIGAKLDAIFDLQTDRLSQPPPDNLRHIQGPSTQESQLASAAVKEMAELTQSLKPGDLVDDPALIRSLLTTFAV